ncbi:hypothetical protein KPY62_00220 [Psychrobacter sp. TAE2020]|uniref:hypothetical protein n=1 Tax=Psychrobacter sp. TAE2020 TaxID=2846762 RepID=UPI001C11BC52|nr:hypothetical protein [Psychrobacter sp. TAE2020]MBU5615545.1 hypothetical protein [Psychrobacter sp. TAE2020]
MTKSDNKAADNREVNLNSIRDWLIRTTQIFAKFAIILIALALALLLANALNRPLYISYLIVGMIAAVLFIMLIMIAIENIVYRYLKNSVCGQIIIYLLVALMSVSSYLWATGEINRIFQVNPSNLALTSTLLTAIEFFKYCIIILLSSYFIAIGLYFLYRDSDNQAANNVDNSDVSNGNAGKSNVDATSATNQSTKKLTSKLLSGVLFALTVMLCLLAVGRISKYSDVMIQAFAVNIDFYSYHTCTGKDFENIEGVLFLSASDILVAKKTGAMTWQFNKVKCEP